jgi:hypothetical protein
MKRRNDLSMTTKQLKSKIEKVLKLGMEETNTFLTIEYVYGFELFNTRPYHCHETWCGGWVITDRRLKLAVRHEDLDIAIAQWELLVQAVNSKTQEPTPETSQ